MIFEFFDKEESMTLGGLEELIAKRFTGSIILYSVKRNITNMNERQILFD